MDTNNDLWWCELPAKVTSEDIAAAMAKAKAAKVKVGKDQDKVGTRLS